jgi:hypothetical protein
MGSDCTTCIDSQSCQACNLMKYDAGVALLNDYGDCVSCTACYQACQGATLGCSMPPPTQDPCDMGQCSTCDTCASTGTGTCAAKKTACDNNASCSALFNALQLCH